MEQSGLFDNVSLSVTDLTRYIRQVFDADQILQKVWVSGEISNLSRPSSGHIYFSLKDAQSSLRCVIWRSTAMRLTGELRNGMAVEVHGAVSIYEREGNYQLYVDRMRGSGEGRLYQQFIELRDRLEAEGLFDEVRKRPAPPQPKLIGIVTSPTGAALQDILNTIRSRYSMARVVLAPTAVQGAEAPLEIVRALTHLNQLSPDVIILARGGGSLEDLWAFNDEAVVRAVVASRAPVICGVGHETDFTLADFAADLRAPTPTGAAVAATPDRFSMVADLRSLEEALQRAFSGALTSRQYDLNALTQRLKRESPVRKLRGSRQHLDSIEMRLRQSLSNAYRLKRLRHQGLTAQLQSLSPYAILDRGYAILYDPHGRQLKSVRSAHVGDTITARLNDGTLQAGVQSIDVESRDAGEA